MVGFLARSVLLCESCDDIAFSVHGDLSPPKDEAAPEQAAAVTNQSRPVVGLRGRVKRWTTEPESDGAEADNELQ
jgi:hypothetical protein